MIGERVGTTNCKTRSIGNGNSTMDGGVLYSTDVTQIAKGTSPDTRLYDVMNLRGVTIYLYIENNRTNYTTPLTVSMALLGPKDTGTPGQITATNFFRGNNVTRALDFNSDISGLQTHTLAVNTDDYYVLFHRRFILGLNNTAWDASAENAERNRYFKKYVKINRQVRYNTDDDNATDGRCYFVMWCDRIDRANEETFDAALAVRSFRTITWFRDPKQ